MSRQVLIRDYPQKDALERRKRMLAKIHIEFPKLRPDLRHSTEELRLERLAFCERVLGLRKPLDSLRRLNDKQLGRVIEAIKAEKPQAILPGGAPHRPRGEGQSAAVHSTPRGKSCGPGEIIHLAGPEQVWAIERVFEYLGWSKEGQARFLEKRFNRASARMLSPQDANSLLMILFNIAATNDLKALRGADARISRKEIGRYIPQLKRKLGIDSK
jgi:hypothetical protein